MTHVDIAMPRLLGGALCLDFANTFDPRYGPQRYDFLTSYAALVAWGLHATILTEQQAHQLFEAAQSHTNEAEATLERALILRETIHRIFLAEAHSQQASQDDLTALGAAYRDTIAHSELVPCDTGYSWEWQEQIALDRMVWPVVRSAVELVTSAEVRRVKECPSENCGWLFLDTSKNGSRRWCSMEGCGSRAKMRRQYARKRGKGDQGEE